MMLLFVIFSFLVGSAFYYNGVESTELGKISCIASKVVVEERPEITFFRITSDSGETLLDVNSNITSLEDLVFFINMLDEVFFPIEYTNVDNNTEYYITNEEIGRLTEVRVMHRGSFTVFHKKVLSRPGLEPNTTRCARIHGFNLVIDPKFDVNQYDGYDMTPLVWSLLFGLSSSAKTLVLDRGADVNRTGSHGMTPILAAITTGQTELVDILLQKGADISRPLDGKITPLHLAVYKGRLNIARSLIDHGANVNDTINDHKRMTPLHIAVTHDFEAKVVDLLISKGANVEALDYHQRTPLHHALLAGCKKCAHRLLDAGANVNARDDEGNTPLTSGIKFNIFGCQLELLEEILKVPNLDLSIRNRGGETALSIATGRGCTELAELLKSQVGV